MKKATYNPRHPYKYVREDARNNYENFVDKCIFIMKNLMCFLFLKILLSGLYQNDCKIRYMRNRKEAVVDWSR
jgi:hypothetical protein